MLMNAVHKIVARIAGIILLLFGVGLVAFGLSATVRLLSSAERFESSARIVVAVFLGLGVILSSIGFRLAANRPNKYQSILPPMGWYVLAFLLVALGATFGILAILQKQTEYVTGVLIASLMAWGCWTAAKRTRASASGASVPADNPLGESDESRSGYVRLMTLRGIPVFAHVSLPMGGVLFSMYAGFDFRNSFYYCVGYVLLIGAHEAGHALAAILFGIKVSSIDISGAGGVCRIEAPRKASHGAVVFSAGIVVQLILLGATLLYVQLVGYPTSRFGRSLVATFTIVNVIMVVLNLMPMRVRGLETDGAVLWRLFRHAFGNLPNPFEQYVALPIDESPVFPPDTRLLTKPSLVPKDFEQGIEVLNDANTPMEVVVACLSRHLGLNREGATRTMLAIHNQGGVLIALPSKERAVAVAAAITAEVEQHGHVLVCRAVEVPAE
jgi:ATP-dependent Clp protease adapter protein ClpS